MKKIIVVALVAMFLTLNLAALTWGGVDLGKWGVFQTNDKNPPK